MPHQRQVHLSPLESLAGVDEGVLGFVVLEAYARLLLLLDDGVPQNHLVHRAIWGTILRLKEKEQLLRVPGKHAPQVRVHAECQGGLLLGACHWSKPLHFCQGHTDLWIWHVVDVSQVCQRGGQAQYCSYCPKKCDERVAPMHP
eukprot:CAMPEP_0202378332 /NCGR_PEP_ID=MMETSP1127-20130417/17611_1 /ASSEMBLY_ACC=CAM_ASM_000462 /TAXON_ID=3047 /ORGANISM="Dunaliella tertiolecta, Strain CCMP1320" /LENGTH=143 /DNA_ID=CAMNT_0048976603 /DNA_START=425 /DNA_END=856 /DNA_ORIENTATION=+